MGAVAGCSGSAGTTDVNQAARPTLASMPPGAVKSNPGPSNPKGTGSPTGLPSGTTSQRQPTASGSDSARQAPTFSGPVDCVSVPENCGYPSLNNTGIPAGSALSIVPGDVTKGTGWHWDSRGFLSVDTNGAVLKGLDVSGTIEVTASNVTIENVRVLQDGDTWGIGLYHSNNVTISHCEVYSAYGSGANRLEVGIKDIYGDAVGTTIQATNIWHASTGIQISAGLIKDNYIHDMGYVDGDHIDGFASDAGRGEGLTIDHNTILDQMDQTTAIGLFEDFGPQLNAVVENNLIAGGSYSLYGGANTNGQPTSNIRVIGNRFARLYFPTGGVFGPVASFDPGGTGNVWQGNIWDDTGQIISVSS